MTDQIPADKVRAILANRGMRAAEIIAEIEALLPTPTRPTLADMPREERHACQWMQADVADYDTRYVITNPCGEDDEVELLAADGKIEWILPEYVTPLPDIPRMEWPSNKKPAPALPDGWRLADHQKHGRGIVTNPTSTRDGRVYFVIPADDPMGYDWFSCRSDDLTYIDQEVEDVTPVKAGDVIDSADDPRIPALPIGSILLDRDGEVVTKRREEWEGGGRIPIPYESEVFGPWTVLHIPKKDDQ